jgi:RNA polymerase sigma-70 factor (ECF subfamily)
MDHGQTDESLMAAYRDGDAAAFERLYDRHKGPLYRYFLRQVRDRALAEELYQDVWMRVIQARDRYVPSAAFRTWLYTLAHHRLVDHLRRQGVEPERDPWADERIAQASDPPGSRPDQRLSLQECLTRLLTLIGALPWVQRQVFLLREEADMSLEQIAAVTQVKIETAKSRLRYAMAKLRAGLEDCL